MGKNETRKRKNNGREKHKLIGRNQEIKSINSVRQEGKRKGKMQEKEQERKKKESKNVRKNKTFDWQKCKVRKGRMGDRNKEREKGRKLIG